MKLGRYVGLIPVIFIVACATDSARFGGNTVTYQDPKGINTVSNEFNLTDMNNIAEAMAKKILISPALRDTQGLVRIAVLPFRNDTSEYIKSQEIYDKITTILINSGKVRIVNASNDVVGALQAQQSGLYNQAKTAKIGNANGAKFAIQASLASMTNRNSNMRVNSYVFGIKLTELETLEVVWQEGRDIVKSSKR